MFLMSRNNAIYETQLANAAAEALRSRLPESWRVDLANRQHDGGPVDFQMTLSSSDGTKVVFAADLKTSTQRGSVQDIARLLRTVAATYSDTPLLYVSDYASPPLRRELDDAGISYLDTTGWASLINSDPPVLVRLEGSAKPPRPRKSGATARLTGHATTRTIRQLLEGHTPVGIRALADLSSSSAAAVSKLMPTLVDAGAIERSEDGTITRVRKRTLLDRWVTDYSFTNSNGVVLDYIAPRGVTRTLERIRERGDVSVTGSAAARAYLPTGVNSVVPLTVLALYADDVTETARSCGLVRSDRATSNVMITAPRDRTLLTNVATSASGLQVAPISQVLADLLTLPKARLAQEAEQLIDILAGGDDAWRD